MLSNIYTILKQAIYRVLVLSLCFSLININYTSASEAERNAIFKETVFYDEEDVGCDDSRQPAGSTTSSVYILGDAIVNQSREEINIAFRDKSYPISSINADEGRGITRDFLGNDPPGILAVENDKSIIANSKVMIISLGTNSLGENLSASIPQLMSKVRSINPNIVVYWANVFYPIAEKDSINAFISNLSDAEKYIVIDTTTANIKLNSSNTLDTEGETTFANLLARSINVITSIGGSALSLTYPDFDNEDTVKNNLTNYIKTNKPNSPWLDISQDFGSWLFAESKSRDINPLLIAAIGKQENVFGTVGGKHVSDYHNYFGMKGSTPIDILGSDYKGFNTPLEGMTYFLDTVKENTQSSDRGIYANVTNFYEYQSMHQSGRVKYPGEPLDPDDRTGPVFDSNNNWIKGQSAPDNNTEDSYDPTMGAYISWTTTDHPNNAHDGTAYNPGVYYKNSVRFINELTGLSLSDTPAKGSVLFDDNCPGTSNNPLLPGSGGWDLPKEGPNPMVYYSQLNAGNDPSVDGYFGTLPYGTGTIQACGCGPTSYAMAVATLTSNKIKPDEMAKWAYENNGQMPGCGSYWFWNRSDTINTFKVNAKSIVPTAENIKNSLLSGKMVIFSVLFFPLPTSPIGGHISLIRKYENGKFYLADAYAEKWAGVNNVSRYAYSEADMSSIVRAAWELSAL